MTGAVMRQATPEDLRIILDWAAAEGWNPGLDDAQAFLAADPDGFFVAEVNQAPVASISVVNHSDSFSFLGLYICKSEFRGRGIGYALWNHAIAYAGPRTVGLDGVAAQEANYAKSGFVRSGATIRFEGGIAPEDNARVRDMRTTDLPTLIEMDREANGHAREEFLKAWLTDTTDRRTAVLIDDDKVTGFATIRRCGTGAKIGPVIAPHAEDSMALLRSAGTRLPSSTLVVDVPSGNTALIEELRRHGFVETFRTARMYRGEPPRPSDMLMAIGTMELG